MSLKKLSPSTTYRILVYAENGVSAISGQVSVAEIIVKTESSIPTIINVKITNVGPTSVTIGWELARNIQHPVIQFEVISFPRTQPYNKTSYMTNVRNFTFRDLKLNTNYGFQVGSIFTNISISIVHLIRVIGLFLKKIKIT